MTRREAYQVTIRVEDEQDTRECTLGEHRTADDDVMLGLGVALAGALAGVDNSWIGVMRTLASAAQDANEHFEGCPYKDDPSDDEVNAIIALVDAAYKAVDALDVKVRKCRQPAPPPKG